MVSVAGSPVALQVSGAGPPVAVKVALYGVFTDAAAMVAGVIAPRTDGTVTNVELAAAVATLGFHVARLATTDIA
jgi:hypothetical protein